MPYYPVQVLVTPAGSDRQVQFNDAGAFGADAGLSYASNAVFTFGTAALGFGIVGANGSSGDPSPGTGGLTGGNAYDDGIGTAANGGGFDVQGGYAINGGDGGSVNLFAGNSDSGQGGTVGIYGGSSDTGTPGDVDIRGGSPNTQGPGGNVSLRARDGVADANPDQNGGSVTITVGTATGSGTPGVLAAVNVSSAAGTGNVTVGNVAPGTTAIAVTAWMRITVDGTPYLLPLFA